MEVGAPVRNSEVLRNGRKRVRRYIEEEEVLDREVWKKLPDSIFVSVFQFLAWEDVFRFRAVRKEWDLFLRSPKFKMSWHKDPDQVPICFASSNKINSFYNPATERWHISGVDLPPSLSSAASDIPKDVSKNMRGRRFPVVSASNGLILIQMYTNDITPDEITMADFVLGGLENGNWDVREDFMGWNPEERRDEDDAVELEEDGGGHVDEQQQVDEDVQTEEQDGDFLQAPETLRGHREMLLLVNPLEPLRKECIKAVPYLQDNYCQHEIIWDPKFRTYELLARSADISQYHVDGNCVWSIIFHRYDFNSGTWKKIVSWSTHRFISLESSCLIGGQLVCLGRPATLRQVNNKPYRIYGMELSQGASIEEMELTAPQLPSPLSFAILFYYEGMYMVAGGEVNTCTFTLQNFKVWKKQEIFRSQDDDWVEVIEMPKLLVHELNECGYGVQYTCKANGRFLCVANRVTDVVMCDLKKRSWWRLPVHPRGKDAASEGLALCDPRFDVNLAM